MAIDFLSLPSEVIHNIFNKVEPADLARLRRTCHRFNDFIQSDWLVVKDIFLQHFDDPRSNREASARIEEPLWEADLHKYVKTSKILASSNADLKQAELINVAETIGQLVKTSLNDPCSSRNLAFIAQHFKDENQQNRDIFVCSSSLFKLAESDVWKKGSSHDRAHADGSAAHSDGINLCHAPFRHRGDSSPTSKDLASHAAITETYEMEGKRRMLSAKIHCLYGVPVQELRRGVVQTEGKRYSLRSDTTPLHPYVRSRVYDLRQHTKNQNASFWGPYLSNGTQEVDWEKLEAIMVILHHNMLNFARTHDLFCEDAIPDWTVPFKGVNAYTYRSKKVDIPMSPPIPLEAQDPYNVSGTWMRVVCFLDYSELYEFNFGQESLVPPSAALPPLDREEATRLITMRIQVTKITPPGEDEGKAMPVVHFKGTSSSVRPSWDPNANSEIKEQGTVKLTPQGEVRWTTWSIFHGEERWRSEGIQIGGPQSARGVLGFWFDKDYDIHGPAGPTAFWKSHDGIEKRPPHPSRMLNSGLHALHVPLY